MELKTTNYYIRFDDADKSIFMRDLTDVYNETAAYNKAKRGYKGFKNAIVSAIQSGDLSTFNTWVRVADTVYKLNMHTWCMVD